MDRSGSKRVLITGAASGLGKALALKYARQGHHVAIVDLNDERGAETLVQLKLSGVDAFYQRCDVRKMEDVEQAVAATKKRWGGIDILINNAGVAAGGPFDWVSSEDWEWVMDINFFGVLRGCQASVPVMKEQGSGHLVNIASMAGLLNPPGMSNYNVSKAAVVSLSETLVAELQPWGIGVTCVCPSFFKTNLGESMRSPDKTTAAKLDKLVEGSSDLSADDIATMIYDAVEANQFLVMPHEKARQAWDFKCANLDDHLKAQHRLAQQVKDQAQPAD
ncbi:MAG: SDR family oxidoreductase [Ketobacter sp.]|nr:MAG: SDR family oxidoreductase [Ketobacter sp.]